VWRGAITLRKLWARMRGLPRTSRFVQASGGALVLWGVTEHAIGDLIDVTLAVHGIKEPWQRPGDDLRKQRQTDDKRAEFARWAAERQKQLEAERGAGGG
jgi:hypothetical protein